MRIGEAIALGRDDVDLERWRDHDPRGQVRPRTAGAAAPDGDRGAAPIRGRARPAVPPAASAAFFLSGAGTALDRSGVEKVPPQDHHRAGHPHRDRAPAGHDLRHSFAVADPDPLARAGMDVDERIGVLSTYLGQSPRPTPTGTCQPPRS